jgi:hypothetical protein
MFSYAESLRTTQEYLRNGGCLERLETDHGIASKSDGKHLILDYDQITVKWNEPYGYACRGLVLDAATLDVVAAPLKKFFNYGEHYADAVDFDYAIAFEKIDGTMVNRWWSPHTGAFEYSTRFQLPEGLATTNVNSGMMTWRQMIDRCMASFDPATLAQQPKDETWTFEVCSPHNMVVVRHTSFYAKLLAIKNNVTLAERPVGGYYPHAPAGYELLNADEIRAFANRHPATELEGFVVVDDNFNRIKIKSDQYVALHRAKDGLRSANNILLLARSNDYEEVVVHFPEYKEDLDTASAIIQNTIARHESAFQKHASIESQKEFAIAINSEGLEFTSVLFSVRSGRASSISSAFLAIPETSFCKAFKPKLLEAIGAKYTE